MQCHNPLVYTAQDIAYSLKLTSDHKKQVRNGPGFRLSWLFGLFLMQLATKAFGFDWSITELHYQFGKLKQPFLQQQEADTSVMTFQHINGWRYGNNFFVFRYPDATSKKNGLLQRILRQSQFE